MEEERGEKNPTEKAKQVRFDLVWFLLSPQLKPSYFLPNLGACAAGGHEPATTFPGRTVKSFGPGEDRPLPSPRPLKRSPVPSLPLGYFLLLPR